MNAVESATQILDTLLGHLHIAATIDVEETKDGPCLQVHTDDFKTLVGKNGDRLDDLQYLVNRILRRKIENAPRIRIDCAHYRTMQEDELQREITSVAERVKATGNPYELRPLNAYYRRLVHNILAEDPEIHSTSPSGDDRLKRITISSKKPSAAS